MLHNLLLGLALAAPQIPDSGIEPGCLQIMDKEGRPAGFCPLEGTKVEADIAGFGARVTVRQTFLNPSKVPIEAVYNFPLPADAAVDQMNMRLGDRLVQGEIKRREEARRVYEAAKNAGQATALLDQERPNLFTQSVANILPGSKVSIEISYVQLLKFEEDKFEFSYPMVVGPRFLGNAPDPGKIAPPITPKGTRTGATIDLTVRIDAGAPITTLDSELHEIEVAGGKGQNAATVTLAKKGEIPNRDFILRYGVASSTVQSALLTYADARNGGFFTLILMPPKAPTPEQIAPREVIFVVDQSGSQSGFPIQKSRELCRKMIDALRPGDTFNAMGFANGVNLLWPEPRPATSANMALAHRFIAGLEANGGTQLFHAVNAALTPKPDPKRVRLVLFNTDGFVGDEFNILDAIQHRGGARMFTFGIGNSVNRFLIDAMSAEGRGDSEIVTLAANTDKAVEKFVRRTQTPVLTQIDAKFEGVTVADVLPNAIPDVYSEKPVILKGRYTQPGKGKIVITGILGDQPWRKEVALNFPDGPLYQTLIDDLRQEADGLEANESPSAGLKAVRDPNPAQLVPANSQAAFGPKGSAIATLWAREMIDEVSRSNWLGMYSNVQPELRTAKQKQTVSAVTLLGLRFGLMTQYTSFVAVEKRVVNVGGKQRTVAVPVEMADGVSYEGIFGSTKDANVRSRGVAYTGPPASLGRSGAPGGAGGGLGGGGFGGANAPATLAKPAAISPNSSLKAAGRDDSLGLGGRISYDESKKEFSLREANGLVKKKFDALTDKEIEELAKGLNQDSEKAFLKTLTPVQTERYFLVAKVDSKLRNSKEAVLSIQIWVADWKTEYGTSLRTAGLKEIQPSPALRVAFGSCDKATLRKLASLPFVKRIVPIEG